MREREREREREKERDMDRMNKDEGKTKNTIMRKMIPSLTSKG